MSLLIKEIYPEKRQMNVLQCSGVNDNADKDDTTIRMMMMTRIMTTMRIMMTVIIKTWSTPDNDDSDYQNSKPGQPQGRGRA